MIALRQRSSHLLSPMVQEPEWKLEELELEFGIEKKVLPASERGGKYA